MQLSELGGSEGLEHNATLNRESLVALGAFSALTAGAVFLNARSTREAVEGRWYKQLKKPSFQPPRQAFGPVWTTLYGLIAVSGWRIWGSPAGAQRSRALGLWFVQLGLNAAWSHLFFRKRQLKAAAVENWVLLGGIAAYTAAASRVDRKTPWFMAPYLGWVGFANVLSTDIARLNG
ncbi:tryptophan-rich sensory protein [Corallococcus sp. AB049A]|uniref:TspO/MBR family protein n=1 Tax=Corallococcus sp. AB049A TaxID=2316721 RepID=UPI000EC50645|nr:TspO/MBR family protein [Corallococcus sp. AB049A]RKI53432.1 tryptophan-rich sensory protein [Corallococcus sp. AB049A]